MKPYCIFIIALVLSSCSLEKKYIAHNQHFETAVQALQLKKDHFDKEHYLLFIGSSSIRLWTTADEDLAPYQSVLRGYGGAHYYDLVHFVERLTKGHQKADAVFLFVANDITGNQTQTHSDLAPAEVKRLFVNIYKKIKKQLGAEMPIFVIETTPTPKRWQAWPQIAQANALIRSYTETKKNLFYIATAAFFLDGDGQPVKDYFVSDQLHLNAQGYKLWGQVIKTAFEAESILNKLPRRR